MAMASHRCRTDGDQLHLHLFVKCAQLSHHVNSKNTLELTNHSRFDLMHAPCFTCSVVALVLWILMSLRWPRTIRRSKNVSISIIQNAVEHYESAKWRRAKSLRANRRTKESTRNSIGCEEGECLHSHGEFMYCKWGVHVALLPDT